MDNKKYFTRVINENEGIIYKVSSLYTNSREDRDDLYQEIIYQLWKSFPTFKEQSKISTWLYRVALNTAIYQLKKSKRSISAGFIDKEALSFIEEDHQPEEEQLKLFYAHIDHLGLMEKGIILLYLEGKNHEEIADIVGLTKTNVGTRISRIKDKLKTQINKTN